VTGSRYGNPYGYAYTPSGAPIPGALLNFYVSGTSTRAPTYSDVALTVTNSNPVVADDSGTFPDIFLVSGKSYKVVQTYPPEGVLPPVEVWAADPVFGAYESAPAAFVGLFTSLNGTAMPAGATAVITSGFSVEGIGSARYTLSANPSALPAIGQGKWWFYDAAGNKWAINVVDPIVDMFGAFPDGVTNSTTGIENMWQYCRLGAAWLAPINGPSGVILPSMNLQLGAGSYIYSGTGLLNDNSNGGTTSAPVNVCGIGRDQTRLTITSACHFITANAARSAYVHDLEVIGGWSFIYWNSTNGLVTASKPIFERCNFVGYSKFAIGSDSTDHPGLQVEECNFDGTPTTGTVGAGGTGATFGIAWCGYCDEVTGQNNIFGGNAIDVKLGGVNGVSGSFRLSRNGFFSGSYVTGTSNRIAAIWIVARTGSDNSGYGGVIEQNKFGNEQRAAHGEGNTPRILFALPDTSATNPVDQLPSSSLINGYVMGVNISGNTIAGSSGESAGIIRSYVTSVAFNFFASNIITGTYPAYYMEYGSAVQTAGLFSANNAFVPYIEPVSPAFNNDSGGGLPFCNIITFVTPLDFAAEAQDNTRTVLLGAKDCGYRLLAASSGIGAAISGGSSTTVVDARGMMTARQFVGSSKYDNVYISNVSGYDANFPLWAEIEIRAATSRSLSLVQLDLDRYSSYAAGDRRPIKLGSTWRTVTVPVNFRATTGNLSIAVQSSPLDFSAGVRDTFQIGNIRVYQSQTPHDGIISLGYYDPADATYSYPTGMPDKVVYVTNLTAQRDLVLLNANRLPGDLVRVVRADAGAFNVLVKPGSGGAGAIATLAAGQQAIFMFTIAGAWIRIESGVI